MEIKTLAQILAETEHQTGNKPSHSKRRAHRPPYDKTIKAKQTTQSTIKNKFDNRLDSSPKNSKRSKKVKPFHPAAPYQPKIAINNIDSSPKSEKDPPLDLVTLKHTLQAVDSHRNNSNNDNIGIDNLLTALKPSLKTPVERQAEKEALKANSRLRWLAFYYLSRREHSAAELKQKLIDKEQDPKKIDALLKEFKEKGYQSDYRTAMMLIREGIRKRQGRTRIKQSFYQRKVSVPNNIDELIDMAMSDSEEFSDFVSHDALVDGVDWLKLAVEARTKKYGDALPTEPKDKAKQLRFLQYRGFKPDICFDALKYSLQTLDKRF